MNQNNTLQRILSFVKYHIVFEALSVIQMLLVMNNQGLRIANSYIFFTEIVMVLCIYEVFFTNHILIKTLFMTLKFGFLLFSLTVFNIDIPNIVYISMLQALFLYVLFKSERWYYSFIENVLFYPIILVIDVLVRVYFSLISVNTYVINAVWLFTTICILIDYSNMFGEHFPYSLNVPVYQKAIRFFRKIKKPECCTYLVPLLFLALYNNISILIRIGFAILFLISLSLSIKQEYHKCIFYKKLNKKIPDNQLLNFIAPVVYLFFASSLYYLVKKNIDKSIYDTIVNNAFTVVSGIALLNLGALFVLLQKNYEKFGSTVLVSMLLKTPILLFTTVFPFVLLIEPFPKPCGSKDEILNRPQGGQTNNSTE